MKEELKIGLKPLKKIKKNIKDYFYVNQAPQTFQEFLSVPMALSQEES